MTLHGSAFPSMKWETAHNFWFFLYLYTYRSYKLTTSPCASVTLSWKRRSLASYGVCINRVHIQRDKIGACTSRLYMHACMPNLVSLPATHQHHASMRTLASDVIARNWSHAFLSSKWHVLPFAKLATSKLASRSRQGRPGTRTMRAVQPVQARQDEETRPSSMLCACLLLLQAFARTRTILVL
jgi:hypothetical protein